MLDMNLEDWMNANHFPPLSLVQKNPTVAIGLPKHLQPDNLARFDRIKHHKVPSIVVVDSYSIVVGNLPIQISWIIMDQLNKADNGCARSTEQIMQELQPLWVAKLQDVEAELVRWVHASTK